MQTEREWTLIAATPATTGAFYLPRNQGGPRIFLGPTTCADLRQLTRRRCDRWLALRGVATLAHELEHALQDKRAVAFDEAHAERLAWARAPGMLRRLERAFGSRCT